jgi:hypothetical protein
MDVARVVSWSDERSWGIHRDERVHEHRHKVWSEALPRAEGGIAEGLAKRPAFAIVRVT